MAAAEEEEWAEDSVQDLAKCTQLSVPNVARTPKCLSCPEATSLFTAATALASNAQAAVPTDNEPEGHGLFKA